MTLNKKQSRLLSIAACVCALALIILAETVFTSFARRIFNLCGIYIILALSLNLVNGFTGLFSLGHAGFMAVGAYVSALLTMSPAQKEMNFFLTPIIPALANIELPFIPALLIAGAAAGLLGFLIGTPVLRLRDDYLAIATLGFSEIIRVVLTNLQSVTNGALGLKGLPKYASTYMIWALAALSVIVMFSLVRSAYGRSLKAVRDNEIAAQAMGINVARVKIVSFTLSSFIAGIGGALLGHLMNTIDPRMFTFSLTYNIVLIVVLGGNGSISGSVVAAAVITVAMEALRFLDGPLNLLIVQTTGLPGLRMVVFSALLLFVVVYRQQGLMGNREFSWNMLFDSPPARRLEAMLRKKRGGDA